MGLIKRTYIWIIEKKQKVENIFFAVLQLQRTAFIEYTLSSHRQFQHQLQKENK